MGDGITEPSADSRRNVSHSHSVATVAKDFGDCVRDHPRAAALKLRG